MEAELKEIKQNVVISMEKKIDELKASLLVMFYVKVQLGHLYFGMGNTVKTSFNGGKLAAKDYID